MSSVGSYVLSSKERSEGPVDPRAVCARVLKALPRSRNPVSFRTLMSETRFPEAALYEAIEQLRRDRMIEGPPDGLSLTDLGYRAQFIVAG